MELSWRHFSAVFDLVRRKLRVTATGQNEAYAPSVALAPQHLWTWSEKEMSAAGQRRVIKLPFYVCRTAECEASDLGHYSCSARPKSRINLQN